MVQPLRDEVVQKFGVDQFSVVQVESPERKHHKLEGDGQKCKVSGQKKTSRAVSSNLPLTLLSVDVSSMRFLIHNGVELQRAIFKSAKFKTFSRLNLPRSHYSPISVLF